MNVSQFIYLFAAVAGHSTLLIFSFRSISHISYACGVHCVYDALNVCSIDLLIDDGKINDEKKTKRIWYSLLS